MLVVEIPSERRFELGRVVVTQGALAALGENDAERSKNCSTLLARHAAGDWGECGKHDAKVNEGALVRGQRLLSVYTILDQRIWAITGADRSATTLLLPDEY